MAVAVCKLLYSHAGDVHQEFSGWKTYADSNSGFAFRYPTELLTGTPVQEMLARQSDLAYDEANIAGRMYLLFPISDTMASTSGISSFASFGALSQSTSTCQEIGDGKEKRSDVLSSSGKVTIDGLPFDAIHWGGCGPTGCLELFQYSMMHNGLCYKANLEIVGDSPLDPATSFEIRNARYSRVSSSLRSIFDQIFTTLKFTK